MKKASWGFDIRDIDASVRPQDDFFQYANGGWFKRTKIPGDEARWGTFLILRKRTEEQLKVIVERAKEPQIRGAYRSGMNMKIRNNLGVKPLRPFLAKISAIKTKDDVMKCVTELHRYGIGVLWGAMVDQDEKDSTMNILHVFQSGLGLPDREYYLGNKPEQIRVRDAYCAHIEKMFGLLGKSADEAKRSAEVVMSVETHLAKVSMKKEDVRNPDKTYHKMKLAMLQKASKNIPWSHYLKGSGLRVPKSLNVMQPAFIKTVSRMIATVPIEHWQTYLTWHLVSDSAAHLSEPFIQANFDFYGTVLTGTREMKPLWRRSLALVNGALGELLGQIYVKRHFPPDAKKKMDELVSNLFSAYEERIKNLEWMTMATKKRALAKLHMMNRKIGYPKKWRSYKGLIMKTDDYFGNVLRSSLYEHRRNARKLGKKVDRSEWHMTPQTVNAYYNPGTNDIAFPAAILQPPYFGEKQDDAINYGAIGGVIGHEITHGFDNEGSKFDGHGNLHMWWSKKDRQSFERRARVLEKQFSEYSLHGVHVNGKLTLGENIADLGGYAIALDAYHRHLEKTGHSVIDSLTPVQRFFFGVAQDWREMSRPEMSKTLMHTDPHAPPVFRTNGPASNLPEFYEAFGVKKGHKLYRSLSSRAKIW